MKLLAPLTTAAALAIASPASAYWEYGHQTVARIALANVKPATRAKIRRILATDALLDTPECPAKRIEDASTWADCVKPLKDANGKARFGYAYNWHFQDVNICKPFELETACKDGNCVSAQIEKDVAALRNPRTSQHDRVLALVFLIHFVGDLHQPLHAGEHDDKGGNDVAATYGTYSPRRFNLHSVWDGTLAERAITSGPSLVRRYSVAKRKRLAAGTVTDWSREAYQVARSVVYPTALGRDVCADGEGAAQRATLDEATIQKIVPVARLEVERGGLRLAKLLDRALA
ncbi:S1/P1 nuclease [Sphingomonas aerophila]|jgi:hypothetical protein|uniref:Endonuclease n=1 Tax=Sphingomonas aerophila TaxID=1344948 RepID=A0A7W9BAP7_9SPHN|nr:S1/P1 nuclease [Sphingomonas aerophila]MBB5713731.1 hypothetical protein [Sphingomonas aerophila]